MCEGGKERVKEASTGADIREGARMHRALGFMARALTFVLERCSH